MIECINCKFCKKMYTVDKWLYYICDNKEKRVYDTCRNITKAPIIHAANPNKDCQLFKKK